MAKRKHTINRKGLLPGEFIKRSLITIPAGLDAACIDLERGKTQDLHYVVTTRRQDNIWTIEVEYQGQRFRMPHQVVERINQQREAIMREQRHVKAVENAQLQIHKSQEEVGLR